MIVEAIIFWLIGGFVALLGNENIRDYKCFDNPRLYLAIGIFLCFLMSWAMFVLSVMFETYSLPLWLYHDCYKHSDISYEEEYFDKDGNRVNGYPFHIHNTYRVYTCRICGKVKREQLQ